MAAPKTQRERRKAAIRALKAYRKEAGARPNFLLASLATMLVVDSPDRKGRRYKRRTPAAALRADFARIGEDMSVVVQREREREEAGG